MNTRAMGLNEEEASLVRLPRRGGRPVKRVIDGRVYDTATASCVSYVESSLVCDDFGWWEEYLCITRKGKWFTAGCGNYSSRYGSGPPIRPLSDTEARQWLEAHEKTNAILAHFDVEEA